MICRCLKEYKMSWAGHSIICQVGKDYRCKLIGSEYIFIDFTFLNHYDGFRDPCTDEAPNL